MNFPRPREGCLQPECVIVTPTRELAIQVFFFTILWFSMDVQKAVTLDLDLYLDRVPRGEVPRAGWGEQDAGHGLHVQRQEDRQRPQHASQGTTDPIFAISNEKNDRVPDKPWCSPPLSPTRSERFPRSSSTPTSSFQVKPILTRRKDLLNIS